MVIRVIKPNMEAHLLTRPSLRSCRLISLHPSFRLLEVVFCFGHRRSQCSQSCSTQTWCACWVWWRRSSPSACCLSFCPKATSTSSSSCVHHTLTWAAAAMRMARWNPAWIMETSCIWPYRWSFYLFLHMKVETMRWWTAALSSWLSSKSQVHCYLLLKWPLSLCLIKPRWLLGWSTWPATFTSTKTSLLGTFLSASSSTSRSPTWVSPERSTRRTTTASSPKPCCQSAGCPPRPSLTASSPRTRTSGRLESCCGRSSATACSPTMASPTRKWWRWWERGSCCPAPRTAHQGTLC